MLMASSGDSKVDASTVEGHTGTAGMYIGHKSFRNMFKEAVKGGCVEVGCHDVGFVAHFLLYPFFFVGAGLSC